MKVLPTRVNFGPPYPCDNQLAFYKCTARAVSKHTRVYVYMYMRAHVSLCENQTVLLKLLAVSYFAMAPLKCPGCGQQGRTEFVTPDLRHKWARWEGLEREWLGASAWWTLSVPCHKEVWPGNMR